jgi:hypothetical protein
MTTGFPAGADLDTTAHPCPAPPSRAGESTE